MIEILVALLLFILTLVIIRIEEGFYDPSKEDQRLFGMEDHSYDGDLFQSETLLYNSIKKMEEGDLKNHLSELLNILQFI
jgi:hypothetical protein